MQSSLQNEREFIIIDMDNGILLKRKKLFPKTKLDDVAGCLKYQGLMQKPSQTLISP